MSKQKTAFIISLYVVLISISIAGTLLTHVVSLPVAILAAVCFSAVISSALLISWGAECYQFVVSQGFAVAVIALLQVIPEFLVEGVIAWQKDVPLMLANFTGSNRLLMGLGWSGVFFIASAFNYFKTGKFIKEIKIREEHSIEIVALLVSSLYFVIVLLKGTITIVDSAALLAMFVAYMWALFKLSPEEKEKEDDLIDMCKVIVNVENKRLKTAIIFSLFLVGGITFLFIAEPFINSLREIAGIMGISSFLFVQWVAPFLSEFPEKVTAFYWASQIKMAPMGLINFISSKVNQWTLLIAMVPIVYSVSMGELSYIPLDDFHKWQILLSMVMTLYGVVALSKFNFNFVDAVLMFSLWFIQFVFPSTLVPTTYAFSALVLIYLIAYRKENRLFRSFAYTWKKHF